MSRKDYELIAQAFRDEARQYQLHTENLDEAAAALNVLRRMSNRLASRLLDDNSRFDTQKFVTACGF